MLRVVTSIEDKKIAEFTMNDGGELGDGFVDTGSKSYDYATHDGNNLALIDPSSSLYSNRFIYKSEAIDLLGRNGVFRSGYFYRNIILRGATTYYFVGFDSGIAFIGTSADYDSSLAYLMGEAAGKNGEMEIFTYFNDLDGEDLSDVI